MIKVGTKVQAFFPKAGRIVKGVVVYQHETRNPYSADRVAYGVRWNVGGTGDGWTRNDLTVIE